MNKLAGGEPAHERRIERLRHELADEGIDLPTDDRLLALLLSELDYARHPHAHEGVAPRYGALVGEPGAIRAGPDGDVELIDLAGVPLNVARRLADGRSSFVARRVGGADRLVCFARTREYESQAVHLAAESGAFVVQRLGRGWVRLTTSDGVSIWDGIEWETKPLAAALAVAVGARVIGADPVILANLLELADHWLAAGRVGASLVWSLERDPRRLAHVGLAAAVTIPALDLRRRSHFAALLNALSQYDRAALVDRAGTVATVGAHLRTSDRSRRSIPPYRGTRHTSAMRFTADEPTALVVVVSSNGPLSVFWQGERLAL